MEYKDLQDYADNAPLRVSYVIVDENDDWKTIDNGEMVSFSTEEEAMTALETTGSGIMKITLYPEGGGDIEIIYRK